MKHSLRNTTVSLPELALIAGTRAILGIGIGLLLADRLNSDQRKAVGWTMFSIGAISTIPLAFEVFGGERPTRTFRNRMEVIQKLQDRLCRSKSVRCRNDSLSSKPIPATVR